MFLKQLLNPSSLRFKPHLPLKKKKPTQKINKIGFFAKLSLFFISIYQAVFSGWMGGGCRFHPSCSDYASLVYQNYPFFKASSLVLKRLLSCHPLGPVWREEPEIQQILAKK